MVARTTVLRFSAGGMSAAVSARHVSSIEDRDTGAPHIGGILGLPTGAEQGDRRTVHLCFGQRSVSFVVDDPVAVHEIEQQDVRPVSGIERGAFPEYLLGFAQAGDQLVALLDVREILSRLDAISEEE